MQHTAPCETYKLVSFRSAGRWILLPLDREKLAVSPFSSFCAKLTSYCTDMRVVAIFSSYSQVNVELLL